MKRALLLLAVLVLALGVVAAQDVAYPDLPDLGGQEISVAVENYYPPMQFEDPRADSPVGYDYDVVEEVCRRINCVPVYELTSWDVQMAAVGEGQFDIGLNGISIKEERMDKVRFSVPYAAQDIYLLVHEDEDRFSNIDEFLANEDLRLAVTSGGSNFWLAQGYIDDGLMSEDRRVVFNGFAEAVLSLANGDVDAVPADASSVSGFVNVNGAPVKLVGDVLMSDQFGVIFPLESNDELLAAFDAALETMREDGYLDYLTYKWFVSYEPPMDE